MSSSLTNNSPIKTVLVTGGAGFIGSHCTIELIEAGYEVIIVDAFINASKECLNRMEKILDKKLIHYTVNLLNSDELDAVFQKHKIDAVIHFAGLKAVGESVAKPILYYKNNLIATLNLIELMSKHNVKRLIFSSSATVYGTPKSLPLTEDHPAGGCTNPYGSTKYFIEQILADLVKADPEWAIVTLRYFNPVGAHSSGLIGESPQGVPANLMPFVAQVAGGVRPEVNVFGNDFDTIDGTGVRDYIHVVDLAKGHLAAMKTQLIKSDCQYKIYNLGTGKGYSVLEMIAAMEKASGNKVPYKIVERRPGDLGEVYASTDLAEKELGWKATNSLEDMCKDLWKWQSLNPKGFET